MEKNQQNMQLDRPRLLLPEGSTARRWWFYMAVLALAGLGAWGSFITAFQLPVFPTALVAAGLLSCALTVWLQLAARRWRPVALLVWVVWLLLAVFLFNLASHGAVNVVNRMLDCYGNRLNYDLPVLRMSYLPGMIPSAEAECTVFLLLLQFPFYWLMSHMLAKRRSSLGPFALTGILLLFPMSFSIVPAGWALAALLMFWCMLLLVAPILGGREGLLGHSERYKASGAASARPGTLLLLPAIGLCMLAVFLVCSPEHYQRPKLVDDLRYGVEDGFGTVSFMRGGQGNSNKQVVLTGMGGRSYTGETMLRVKFEWGVPESTQGSLPAKEYLKSFVGSRYTGQSWERLAPEDCQELDSLTLQAQNQLTAIRDQLYVRNMDFAYDYRLLVENVQANPRCVYVPVGLSSTQEELAGFDMEYVDDGYVKSGNFLSGTKEYSLHGISLPNAWNYFSRMASLMYYRLGSDAHPERYTSPLGSRGSAHLGNFSGGYYGSQLSNGGFDEGYYGYEEVEITEKLYRPMVESLEAQGQAGGPNWNEDLWKIDPQGGAYQQLSPEDRALVQDLEAYNDFVYRHYLQVPEELEEYLDLFRETFGLNPYSTPEESYCYRDGAVYFADEIAQTFQTYFTYSLSPPEPKLGEDFVEFFLDQSHEGYCVHFATAAVLLLRSAGYPARYAEGYAVPCLQDGWLDIPDYNAHAWVEVYCGGTGWVPVEVTPASTDNPAVYFDATMPEDPQEYIATPQPAEAMPTVPPRRNRPREDLLPEEEAGASPRATATPSPTPGGSSGGGSGQGTGGDRSFLPVMAGCLGLLAAVACGLLLNRVLRIAARKKALSQQDRNQAALKAYGYLLKLYQWEALCGQREEPPERWKELAEKARFGRGMLTADELDELAEDGEKLAKKLRTQLTKLQKLRCWLSGLI